MQCPLEVRLFVLFLVSKAMDPLTAMILYEQACHEATILWVLRSTLGQSTAFTGSVLLFPLADPYNGTGRGVTTG